MSIDTARPAWIITPDTYRHDHRRFLRVWRRSLSRGHHDKHSKKVLGRIMWRVIVKHADGRLPA